MNDLQLFNFEGQDLSVKEINGEVYFNAEQTAIGLGISQVKDGKTYVQWKRLNNYLNNVSAHVRKGVSAPSGAVGKGDYISEPDFYTLAIKANNPVAQKFQYWVTHEVLPAIRKHGAYMTDKKASDVVNNKDGLASLLQQAADQLRQKDIRIEEVEKENKNLTIQLEESNKKANYLDLILGDPTPILITQIANDYGYSAISFNKLLNKLQIQRRVNGQWILYRTYMGKGYTTTKHVDYTDRHGNFKTKIYTVWTQKGRRFIYDMLKKNGILPLIECEETF